MKINCIKRLALALFATTAIASAQTYNESGGLVVMEVENTPSSLGLWQEESSLSGYSGSGYLRFLGNTFETGPATSPLEYTFKINQAGLYYLHLHCAKEIHEGRNDVANDCYVRVEGDYNAGPGPYTNHGDNASLSLLQSNTKYFGGAVDNWKWENGQNSSGSAGNLDPGGHQNKRVAVYDFKAGETYKLVVSGRSKFFRLNRIVFRHTNTAQATAQNLNTPESQTITGGGSSIVYDAIDDFSNITNGDVPYYQDNGNDVLGIAANIVANRTGFARASRTFDGATGSYDVTITTMTEEDGESTYRLLVNGTPVATYINPYIGPGSPLDLQTNTHTWSGIAVTNGDTIAIESNADTNGEIPETGGTAWARGRWRQVEFSTSTNLVKPPAGRIAYVADGNSPDPDDIGANAVVLGLLKGAGLQDRLVHFSNSCDLNPLATGGSQTIDAANELRRQNKLHTLTGEGIGFFGPFPNLTDYYNCRTEQTAAVNDLRDAINASSANDPLWIVEAGEPDIIGYALDAATASKRQYVHIISHHPANDNSGDFFTWQQILDFGITEHQIGDQNVGLKVLISTGLWDWAENHINPAMVWILDQLKYAEADGVVAFQDNHYDCSDAGMIYWWITGANNGGNKFSTPVEIKDMLLNDPNSGLGDVTFPVAHWKLDEGSGIIATDASDYGHTGALLNGVTWANDATRGVYAQFDGIDDRISTPFSYALSSSDDFTWAWWAKSTLPSTDTTQKGSIMVGNRYGATGEQNFEFIKLKPDGGAFANTDSISSIESYDYTDLPSDEWHHYAMVKDGNSYQWYVDGVAQGAPQTINYNESSSIPVLIGGDDDGSGTKVNEHFAGGIDDVVLYQRALTTNEIVDVQNGIYFPPPPVIEILAGWDTWDSATTPTASVTATNISATAATTTAQQDWVTTDERGASNDGTWGSNASSPTASTAIVDGENLTLPNATTDGTITLTITNNGAEDIVLDAFHFDAYAFRPKAARTYALSVQAGGGISAGTVFTSANDAITSVGGTNSNSAHDDIDIALDGLADHTLEPGEAVQFLLAFSGGDGDGSGGHHLFLDNLAVTHSVTTTPVYAPQVNAGSNVSITLPENQVDLTGTAIDNGTVVSYLWTQEAGPNTASLTGANTTNLSAGNLVQGTYTFRLSATDDEGNIGTDDVSVTVIPQVTTFAAVTSYTLINADTDQPVAGFDPIPNGSTISKASVGTSSFNIRVNTSPSTDFGSVIIALSGATTENVTESIPVWALFGDTAGDYKLGALNNGAHTLTATPYDQDNGAGDAGTPLTINFTVVDTDLGLPTVNAGPDQAITLPTSSINLSGSASDNGSITSTVWTQQSGPNTAALSQQNTLNLFASGLIQGTYIFRLTATDNESNTAYDEVSVNVIPEGGGSAAITGELKKWHKVTFSWNGPSTSETAGTNPFSDYRLNVTFSHAGSGKSYTVPGYFAADGNAAESSADSGDVWRAHFAPDEIGEWTYSVSFRTGSDIAISTVAGAGASAGSFDGDSGTFQITATDKTGRDLRGKGRLQYVGKHHLQFAETGEYFIKAGPDAPENFLAYDDFDGTPNDQNNQPNLRKSWSPHAGDYHAASASQFTWQSGKGTEILGAVRYLAQEGLNVFSFLTFSLDGDDDNVFPHRLKSTVAAYEAVADNGRWASANGVYHDRFDISKMAQWERVFEYGTQQGMYLHFKTQETENDDRMDSGELGRERTLYYRELVARYGHHLALNWNLGEENTNNDTQRKAFAQWFYDNDPYRHNVVLHTYPLAKSAVYTPMLGAASKLTGLSLQTNQADFVNVFPDTLTWVQNSASAGVPWVVACDEPGDAQHALRPAGDEGNSWVDGRINALWGNVMAGGAGVEFYFGYQHAESDLNLQNFRSRDGFWDYCRFMIQFFENNNVPFQDMSNENALSSNADSWCLRKAGSHYIVYLKNGGTTNLDLSGATGNFDVRWYDPRNGGALQSGSVTSVTGGSTVSLGTAPSSASYDWVVYVTNGSTSIPTISDVMNGFAEDADVRSDAVITNLDTDTLVPGRSGGGGGVDRSSILVFQLPDLGPASAPFTTATLTFNVDSVSSTPPGVDLYGLGKRSAPTLLASDYYGETGTADPTDAVRIQTNILSSSTGTGSKSSSASSALTTYLNAQYDNGNGIGEYVFLRLSTNAPISGLLRHFVTSADAAGNNGPRIAYSTSVPQDVNTWLSTFTFPQGADTSLSGDADLDGLSTWFEYLFGLDPSNPSSVAPMTKTPEPTTGTFRYTRRNPELSGNDYQVWKSTDLSDWQLDSSASQSVIIDGDVQEVEVTLSGDKPLTGPSMFVQIRAE